MIFDIDRLFSTESAKNVYSQMLRAIEENSMADALSSGVLVGLSGGADSVMLLLSLIKYSRQHGNFPVVAAHINHSIRAEEALRDEEFCRRIASALGILLITYTFDVPAIARERKIGLEEAARDVRYSTFSEIIRGRNDLSCVAVAHNATDNAESLIMNIMRGCGVRGACGIPAVRDNIVRPLLYVPKSDIIRALNDGEIPFVVDSTNTDTEYSRNYVRAEILPRLCRLTPEPEMAINRFLRSERQAYDYLRQCADDFIDANLKRGAVSTRALMQLHPAILTQVICRMAALAGGNAHSTHVDAIVAALGTDFTISLPHERRFVSNRFFSLVLGNSEALPSIAQTPLHLGMNTIRGFDGGIYLAHGEIDEFFSKIYKIAIQVDLFCDIIDSGLFVRAKTDGDAYTYGNMTHKLKKLFNDRDIPPILRESVPVICDADGIVWVAGFGVREDCRRRKAPTAAKYTLSVLVPPESQSTDPYILHHGGDFTQKG